MLLTFFKINFFEKNLSEIPSACQTDWILITYPTFSRAWSGSNPFAKVISRRHAGVTWVNCVPWELVLALSMKLSPDPNMECVFYKMPQVRHWKNHFGTVSKKITWGKNLFTCFTRLNWLLTSLWVLGYKIILQSILKAPGRTLERKCLSDTTSCCNLWLPRHKVTSCGSHSRLLERAIIINLAPGDKTNTSILWPKYNLDINKTIIYAIQFYFLHFTMLMMITAHFSTV